MDKKLAIKVTLDCIRASWHKFMARLGIQYDIIFTLEKSVLMKIKSSFETENM